MNKFARRLILNTSAQSIDFPAQTPSEDFLELVECSTATKAQASLNQRLHLKGCEVNIPLALTSFLISGDWVVRDTENPDKTSFFFLDPNQAGKSYTSRNKEQLKIHFHHVFRE